MSGAARIAAGVPDAPEEDKFDPLDEPETGGAPPLSLIKACAHPGVTLEKIELLGTEAAARQTAKADNPKSVREKVGKIVKGSTPLHCICMNESVTIKMLRAVHVLWKDAAKQRTEVRLGSLRPQMSSRRVATLSLSRSVHRKDTRLCTASASTRTSRSRC